MTAAEGAAAGGAAAQRVDAVFAALSDPTRRAVMDRLSQAGSATPTELAARLPVTRQAVAKHLAALRDAGLVESARQGREIRYRLEPAPFTEVIAWLAAVGGSWDRRLDALRALVADD